MLFRSHLVLALVDRECRNQYELVQIPPQRRVGCIAKAHQLDFVFVCVIQLVQYNTVCGVHGQTGDNVVKHALEEQNHEQDFAGIWENLNVLEKLLKLKIVTPSDVQCMGIGVHGRTGVHVVQHALEE